MGSSSASSALLKAWFSWLKGSLSLVIGLPAALLLVHLEVFGSSPVATALILHRLRRRLRLPILVCMLKKDHDSSTSMSSIFYVGGGPDVIDRAQSPRKPNLLSRKRSRTLTLDDKDRTQQPSGVLPSSPLPLSPPSTPSPPPRELLSQPPLSSADDTWSISGTTLPPSSPPFFIRVPSPSATVRALSPISIRALSPIADRAPSPVPNRKASPLPVCAPSSVPIGKASPPPVLAPSPVAISATLLVAISAPSSVPERTPSPPVPARVPSPVRIRKPSPPPIRAPSPVVRAPSPVPTRVPSPSTVRAPSPVDPPSPAPVCVPSPPVPVRAPSPIVVREPSPSVSIRKPSPSPIRVPSPPIAIHNPSPQAPVASSPPAVRAPLPVRTPSTPAPVRKPSLPVRSPSSPVAVRVPTTPFPALEPFTPVFVPSSPVSTRKPSPLVPVPSTPLSASKPSPPVRVPSTPAPVRKPTMPSHSRSMSSADVVRQGKRLSLQFPIQPAAGSNSPSFSPRSRPQSWVATPAPIPSPEAVSPPEPNILAVVAAQERFVLELKEELAKAEDDLKMLKKHYATQEAIKQRNDIRKVTQLQPLNTTLANSTPNQDEEVSSTLWMQKEMERRKALFNSTKTSQRKTFTGSRHLRTLSLLSPESTYSPSFPQPADVGDDESTLGTMRPPPVPRSATSPDIHNHVPVNGEKFEISGLNNAQRDALLRTGKQMATDFKDGLFNFIEDIRQATVGEDGVDEGGAGSSGKGARKPSDNRPPLQRAASSMKSANAKTGDIGDDFWRQHGLSEPKTSPTNKKTHALKNTRTPQKQMSKTAEEFEDWDNWDTPNDKSVRPPSNGEVESSDESEASSPVSRQASSRTSTRYHSQRHDSKASSLTASSSAGLPDDAVPRDSKRNSIPWPDLVKMSPTVLKRTASHLMKEWEKNLTPPPESRDTSHASGDYIGRSVSPGALV
jgi:hypothetical protein